MLGVSDICSLTAGINIDQIGVVQSFNRKDILRDRISFLLA